MTLDERLPNGLRLVVAPDRVAPVVAVNVAYGAGTSSEGEGEGELAHLFEHMMFEGSARVGPGEHVAALSAHGGLVNGRTTPDCTTYAALVPSHCADLALWLEAERLATLPDGLTVASLDRQRAVVRNEHRQRRLGVPYGSALTDLAERLYPAGHPYHTSMARRADLDAAGLDAVEAFFRTHYVAANAVVAVCGDVDVDAVRDRVAEWFGGLPATPPPAPRTAPYEPLAAPVRETVRAAVPRPRVYVAWRGPVEGTPGYDAFVVAAAVLTAGQGARLRRLVAGCPSVADAALSVEARAKGPSFVSGWVAPADGVAADVAAEAFLATVRDLAEHGPGEVETERAVRLLDTALLLRETPLGGRSYARATAALLHGDAERRPAFVADPDAVRLAAAAVFRCPEVRLTYVPGDPP